MSQREVVKKPFAILELNSVNERPAAVELPLADFSKLLGTFPEYMGMQTRMPGKRLLGLYPHPVYSIFQFWTPMGYANGVYQFDSQVSAAPWLTPPIEIIIPPLPTLPIDQNGNTVTTIGWSPGSPLQIVTNTGGPVGTPNDSNGGPAGQGTACTRTPVQPLVETGMPTINNISYGNFNDSTTITTGPPPVSPVPITKSYQLPTVYNPGGGGFGNIAQAAWNRQSQAFNLGFGNWHIQQDSNSQNTKGNLDFSTLGITLANPPSSVEAKISHSNAPAVYVSVSGIDFSAGGNWTNWPMDVSTFLIQDFFIINPGPNNGIQAGDFIVIVGFRFKWGGVICV